MPGVNRPNDNLFPHMIARMNNRIRAMEVQQQLVISNITGDPIIVIGMQPGTTPAEWGIGVYNKAFSDRIAFAGQNSAGTVVVTWP